MLDDRVKELAPRLFDIGAVRFGSFKLKLHEKYPNAPLSPIYIDLRILRSFPDVMRVAIDVYKELASGLLYDYLADIPTAATPIVSMLSIETGIPMISPRLEQKTHGIKRPIDGVFKPGQIALLVDDIITLASSKLETISVLEENSLRVNDVVVLIDREQGGVEELEKQGYSCHVAFKLRELLKFYLETSTINKGDYEKTIDYLDKS